MYRLSPILDEREIRKRRKCVRGATDMLSASREVFPKAEGE